MTNKGEKMKIHIVVLRGRTNVMRFAQILRYNGYAAKVISLPKDVKLGCGLCVQISPEIVNFIPKMISYYKVENFYGVYTLNKVGLRYIADKIYP